MIESIMAKGFIAISAYMYMFALVALILFIVAIVVNAFFKANRFNVEEIRKLFLTNLSFMTVFALLDYFLV